jgi:hypothetical protein
MLYRLSILVLVGTLCLAVQGAPTPHVFCPSASHYFDFDYATPVDQVAWSQAKIIFRNSAFYSAPLGALVIDQGGYAEFNWIEAGSTSLTITTWFLLHAATHSSATLFSLGARDEKALSTRGYVYANVQESGALSVGHVTYESGEAAQHGVTVNAALVPGEWTHLAAVFDANGTIAVYVNGTLLGVDFAAAPVPYGLRLQSYIGRSQDMLDDSSFVGAFADFAMYHEALGPGVVYGLFDGNVSSCSNFEPNTNFTALYVGAGFEGDIFGVEIHPYDVLTVLVASTYDQSDFQSANKKGMYTIILATVVSAAGISGGAAGFFAWRAKRRGVRAVSGVGATHKTSRLVL